LTPGPACREQGKAGARAVVEGEEDSVSPRHLGTCTRARKGLQNLLTQEKGKAIAGPLSRASLLK